MNGPGGTAKEAKEAQESLRQDTRGAVYVEFLIAFLPFMIFFLCLWQVSILYYANLIMDHAARSRLPRAAAVVVAECPQGTSGTTAPARSNQQLLRERGRSYVNAAALRRVDAR